MPNVTRLFPADSLVTVVAGPALWFAYFLAVYGLNALRCALGIEQQLFETNVVEFAIAALSLGTILALLILGSISYRRRFGTGLRWAANDEPAGENGPVRFLAGAGLSLTLLSLLATVWVWTASWLVPACA